MDRLDFIAETYESIEIGLTKKLKAENFLKTDYKYYHDSFGSRYSIWKNFKSLFAVRLMWDGKDSWFIIEESPFTKGSEPISWADLVIVPLDDSQIGHEYKKQIINDLLITIT